MGCATSKGAASASPAYARSSSSLEVSGSASAVLSSAELGSASIWNRPVRLESFDVRAEREEREKKAGGGARLGNLHRYIEGEQAAAGWPAWLSSVAAEAVQGWVPLKAENFEKLEKIGQGTYSSVFRARNLESGRVVALKKVRFDSVEQESVRFMAREILILRRLQSHPNVVGLEGLITSRNSTNIYLVFEYMEHDLAGLTSQTDITFSEPQIKCYMRQLMAGLEHCHSRGVMHRDIKCANLLVNNKGELKVADFGLANLFTPSASPSSSQPLTSRVVTLWYRPPELLLGATAYEPSVDLWSAGCVFAEMHARRPILQGRTEVEQIHKIFKLCGSPPDDYWRRAKMSHAAVFRPHHPYESRLRDAFRPLMPDAAFRLLAALLSVEPAARGTAAAALASDYFAALPHACDPASLPKYAPNKEMDAKIRQDSRRRRNNNADAEAKRLLRSHKSMHDAANQRLVHAEESLPAGTAPAEVPRLLVDLQPEPGITKHILSGPAPLPASAGFAWAKKPLPLPKGPRAAAATASSYEVEKQEMIKQWAQVAEAFTSSEAYDSRSMEQVDAKQHKAGKKHAPKGEMVEFSGPLLPQPQRMDELLQSHEQQIRRAGRRSWFRKGTKRQQY